MKPSVTVRRFAIAFALTALCVWLTHRYHDSPARGTDDANIFFSYAENLANGHGLVYNAGGERVEGFTSMLWTLLCASVFRLGFHEHSLLLLSMVILSSVQCLFLLVIHRKSAAARTVSWPYEVLFLLLVFSSPSYITWMTITLMDTCLWGAFVAFGTLVVLCPPDSLRAKLAGGVLFALLPLARPEAMLVGPAFLFLLWLRMFDMKRRDGFRLGLSYAGCFAASLLALTCFRLLYFGYPLPNTYYAKVSPSILYNLRHGVSYLCSYVVGSSVVSFGFIIAAATTAWGIGSTISVATKKRTPRETPTPMLKAHEFALAILVFLLLVPVLTGGDHFRMHRFFQPAYPVMCLGIVLLAQESRILRFLSVSANQVATARPIIFAVLFALPCFHWIRVYAHDTSWAVVQSGKGEVMERMKLEFHIADQGVIRGRQLRQLFADENPLPSIGISNAGGIKRTYPGVLIDLLGLNNSLMGHSPGKRQGRKNHAAFHPDVFLELSPDVVLGSPDETFAFKFKGIHHEQSFQDKYVFGTLRLRKSDGPFLTAFFDRDLVKRLCSLGSHEFSPVGNWPTDTSPRTAN